jgi:hypothetical protein
VFVLTRLGLEHTIYRTLGEHANYYTTDVVQEVMGGTLKPGPYSFFDRQTTTPSISVYFFIVLFCLLTYITFAQASK